MTSSLPDVLNWIRRNSGNITSTKTCFLVAALGDPCLYKECEFNGKCVRFPNGTAQCVCREDCDPTYYPICASDNQTYPNYCSMMAESCRTKTNLTVVKEGVCEGMTHGSH